MLPVILATCVALAGCSRDSQKPNSETRPPDLVLLEKKAVSGDAQAQFELAQRFEQGKGVTKNAATAVEWWRKAAVQKHAGAQKSLGNAYDSGEGTPKDATMAVEWWRKAAEQGHVAAQFNLAGAYWLGEGVPKDAAKAVEWWQKLADQGDADSQAHLGYAYSVGEGVSKDATKAVEWWRKAAEQGHVTAQFNLARAYWLGDGVPKEYGKAVEWNRKAAEQGFAPAQLELGKAYRSGSDVPKDAAKAVEWWRKAAAQGDAEAQDWMAWAYEGGEGVAQDRVLAYAWSNLAAAQGSESARQRRDSLTLTAAQRAEAERLSSGWKRDLTIAREGTRPGTSAATAPAKIGTGTAFVVSRSGHAITNHHVVADCKEVRAVGRDGVVKVSITDAVNDIALVVVPGTVAAAAEISRYPDRLRQGDEIVVFGYPLSPVLSSEGNITPGVVSAITGLGNNTNQIQITAPIQPGSSGSPVLNMKGEVVAVVAQKLSDVAMAQATGQIGQNVNFAISGQTLKAFLDNHHVDYQSGWYFSFGTKTTADLAAEARKWTIGLECWK